MPAKSFNSVDFPEPFLPMMSQHLSFVKFEVDVRDSCSRRIQFLEALWERIGERYVFTTQNRSHA